MSILATGPSFILVSMWAEWSHRVTLSVWGKVYGNDDLKDGVSYYVNIAPVHLPVSVVDAEIEQVGTSEFTTVPLKTL